MFDQITSAVAGILPGLYGDEQLAKDVLYRKYGGVAFDASKGFNVESWSSSTIRAIKLSSPLTSKTSPSAGYESGRTVIQGGETLFMFKTSDLPEDASTRDTILDSRKVVYNVKRIEPIFGLITKVTAVSSV